MAATARTRTLLRWTTTVVATALAALALAYAHWELVERRLITVTPGRVYQSAAMPPDELVATMRRHGIRTVIDLRDEHPRQCAAERRALQRAGVRHVHLPTPTYVDQNHTRAFLDAMAAAEPPVLVHCEHGQGRSVMMCAVHRIENEGWSNQQAFEGCIRLPDGLRFLATVWPGLRGFRADNRKGRFVLDYRRQRHAASQAVVKDGE